MKSLYEDKWFKLGAIGVTFFTTWIDPWMGVIAVVIYGIFWYVGEKGVKVTVDVTQDSGKVSL
jgi:hypothetical protein